MDRWLKRPSSAAAAVCLPVQTTQPAGREAWFDPGVFVAAVLDGLTPGARYYYMCARRLVRARARASRGGRPLGSASSVDQTPRRPARSAVYVYTSKYMYGSQRGLCIRIEMHVWLVAQRGYVRRLGMPSACHQRASQPAGA